ncbi:hypothetical protein Tsp_07756 [Trichinella spiralis]|uniref:hypothetical protein n=1 Tax=Trichinella spiralis TaxID=6334 RepID=UPI0001EFCA0D|nr:hypothetical protein Tsp_07756 [Trichinella spiralis]
MVDKVGGDVSKSTTPKLTLATPRNRQHHDKLLLDIYAATTTTVKARSVRRKGQWLDALITTTIIYKQKNTKAHRTTTGHRNPVQYITIYFHSLMHNSRLNIYREKTPTHPHIHTNGVTIRRLKHLNSSSSFIRAIHHYTIVINFTEMTSRIIWLFSFW